MDAQAYTSAIDQRRALRRDMSRRLKALRDARRALVDAAGGVGADAATVEVAANPLAQIEPLIGEAAQLAQQLNQNTAETASLQKELAAARAEAERAASVRRMLIIGAVVVAVVVLYFVFKS